MYKNGLTSPFSKAYNKWYNSLLPDGGGGGGFGGGLGGLAGQVLVHMSHHKQEDYYEYS